MHDTPDLVVSSDMNLGAMLRRSMLSTSPTIVDSKALGFKHGTTAGTRTMELAFRSFLEHNREECATPDNYLRGTGRSMGNPKRAKPLPQLHVLQDTCPAQLNRALQSRSPEGLNVMFYEAAHNSENPSRDYHFKRVHLPNMRTLERVLQRSGGGRRGRSRSPTPSSTGVTSCQISTSMSYGAGGGPSNGSGSSSTASPMRGKLRRGAFPQVPGGAAGQKAALSTKNDIRSFEKKYALLDPLELQNPDLKWDEESLDGFEPPRQQDPCARASAVARLVYTATPLRKTKLRSLVNLVPLSQAKNIFTAPVTTLSEFVGAIGKRLGLNYDQAYATDLKYAFELLATAPFRPELQVYQKMQKETWVLACHFLWRIHRHDQEAMLKMVHLMLQMRDESTRIHKTEVQIMIAAYARQKRHSRQVLHEIQARIVHGERWAKDTIGWRQWEKAIEGSPLLLEAFVGNSDSTYSIKADI